MKTAMKDRAATVLCALGAARLARRRRSGKLAILMFHGVEAEPLTPSCDWVIDSATLQRDLAYVRRSFNVLPLEEALDRLGNGTLPDRAAAITFDDGTCNLLTNAAPVLRELGLPAAVFLATGPMGTSELLWPDRLWTAFKQTDVTEIDLSAEGMGRCALRTEEERNAVRDRLIQRYKELPDPARLAGVDRVVTALGQQSAAQGGPFQLLSWAEARELAADGLVSLYPHTVTHPILSRCDDDKVDQEITQSCRDVAFHTGGAPTIFAYPNGCVQDFDERATAVLRRNGVRWALTTTNGFAGADSDPLKLPRMGFSTDQSFSVFKLKVSGFALRPGRAGHRPTVMSDSEQVIKNVAV